MKTRIIISLTTLLAGIVFGIIVNSRLTLIKVERNYWKEVEDCWNDGGEIYAFEGSRTIVCDRALPRTEIYSQYKK